MPIFEIQGPDGSIYEVDAPDENAAVGAFQGFDGQYGSHSDVPEFDPGVEGYDPKTGMVERAPRSQMVSGAYGAADTASAGFGDELASHFGSLISGLPREQVLSEMRGLRGQAQEDNPGSYLAGQIGGGIAQAAALGPASMAGKAAQGGGTFGRVALGAASDGAILGGTYGAGSGEDGIDRLGQAAIGAGGGFAVGGLAPYAVRGVSDLARRTISPFGIPAERQTAISALEREGVPLTAGQRTGSKALQFSESEIGGRQAADVMADQGQAFTRAAMRRAGQDTLADPDSILAMNQRLSQGFEDISSRNTMQADPRFLGDFIGTLREYNRVLPSEQSRILANTAADIGERIQAGGGAMSGRDYQTIRSRLSKRAKNARNTDNELADAYTGVRNSLDSAMERSINPADVGAWNELRRQWGNKRTLENAIGGAAGEDAAMGVISPARLRMAASAGNRGGYAQGRGDFSELARAGQATMTPLPNSGTASRMSARSLGMMAPTILGAGYGGATGGDMQSAIAGAAAGYGLQKGAGMALMSRPVQSYLSNQAATGPENEQIRAAIVRMIMGGGTPQSQKMLEGMVR